MPHQRSNSPEQVSMELGLTLFSQCNLIKTLSVSVQLSDGALFVRQHNRESTTLPVEDTEYCMYTCLSSIFRAAVSFQNGNESSY